MRHLVEALVDARRRLHELVLDVDDWMGPKLPIVNPILWEIGHVAWFQEHWMLRHARGRAPLRADGDALYDSAKVAHDTRWDLPLPDRTATLAYMAEILERSVDAIADGEHAYFAELAIFHEDMHGEALAYTRTTLGLPQPPAAAPTEPAGPWPGDVAVPGGTYVLGAPRDAPYFVFDNEKWAHAVEVAPFAIARAPVTNAEYAAFVADGGYRRDALWSSDGRRWRDEARASGPLYAPGAPHHPIIHVSWYEAEAYCRWADRRLPTEAEWELAAGGREKRRYPWGETPPTPAHANLDARCGGPVDVAAHAAGDSPFGCRQMLGNTWEWTASRFLPFPGFVADPYAEYSAPWFESPHYVLRGGCWATRARLLRTTWRNFYPPHRRDVFAGFRTCAL
jgi:gamma-glutamyl hercynylcysteine S-oxide synthase